MVGRRGVDQGGSGHRPRRRRVDDARQPRDRPRPLRHRALPPAPEDPGARQGAHLRVVHQDLRHRAPRRAVREQPQHPPGPHARLRARARRGVLRDRRLGAPVLVRVERRARREVRRRVHAARERVGLALVVADHQRRAPADARDRGPGRPVCLRRLRRHRPPGAGRGAERHRRPGRREDRPRRLHPGPRRDRWLPLRPHGHAPGPRPLPRGHRRRSRHGRQEVVQ